MARTLNGNLTGRASHGHDDIYDTVSGTLTAAERAAISDKIFNRMFADVTEYWQLAHTTEAEADAIAGFINAAEAGDLEYGYENDDLYDWARGG